MNSLELKRAYFKLAILILFKIKSPLLINKL